MINLKRNKARGIWYVQASGLLQRHHEKRTLCDGNSFPLGFPTATRYSRCFSHIFPGLVETSPLKRAEDSWRKREDDRNHDRVSGSGKSYYRQEQILCLRCSDPHSGKLLCIGVLWTQRGTCELISSSLLPIPVIHRLFMKLFKSQHLLWTDLVFPAGFSTWPQIPKFTSKTVSMFFVISLLCGYIQIVWQLFIIHPDSSARSWALNNWNLLPLQAMPLWTTHWLQTSLIFSWL